MSDPDANLSMSAWHLFTRLGESQILLPAAVLVVLALLRHADGRALAGRWLLLLCGAVALTTVSKLAFIGWGLGSVALDFTGISGHAMFAAAIHPLLFGALAPSDRPRMRVAAVAVGGLLALFIGVSRVVVDAHSVSEAVAGVLLGATVGAVALGLGRLRLGINPWVAPLVAVWLFAAPALAPRSQTHSMVTQLALKLSGHAVPYTREGLHAQPRQTVAAAQR
jgi:membrane-associated phospholipid phosphatase